MANPFAVFFVMVYNKKVRVSEVKVALFSHFEALFEPFLCLSSNFNVPPGIPPALLKRLKLVPPGSFP